MSIPVRTASDLIRGLEPFDFQHFCTIFLRDLGYQVVFGLPGPDGSQDITGSGPHGPFVAHCTTRQGSQRRLVAKLTNDVSGGAATDLTTHTVRKEIILFWTSRRLDPFRDRQNIESELHAQLATLDSQYHAHPPIITCYSPDTMAQEIVNHCDASAYQTLLNRLGVRRLRHLSADDSIVPEADLLMPSGGTQTRFIEWLDDPSLRSAPSLRATDILRAVLNSAWDTLVLHPVLAVQVLKSDRARNLPDILPFLCSLALDEPVSADSLGSLVDSIERAERGPAMNPADLARDLQLFRVRLLRFLCYRQPLLFTNPDARGLMMSLLDPNDDFQGAAAVDLALRAHCNYIRLDPETEAAILEAARTHIEVRPHSVLAQLWPMVKNPLSTAKARPWLDVLQSLRAIATTVQTAIDARWCITALLRVMPLFDAEENGDYGDDVIQMLLSAMPMTVVDGSTHLLERRLHLQIRKFLRTYDTVWLNEFENGFVARRARLLAPQIARLQIEYTSALYVAWQVLNPDHRESLRFRRLMTQPGLLLDDPLFANVLANVSVRRLSMNPNPYDAGDVFDWLLTYLRELYAAFGDKEIKSSHLRVSLFPSMALVSQMRPPVASAVHRSLTQSLASPDPTPASFWARSVHTFRFLKRGEQTVLMWKYLERALEADPYDILRSALGISEALYFCYFYGAPDSRPGVLTAVERLTHATIDNPNRPRRHWVYPATIRYRTSPEEREFLTAAWQVMGREQSNRRWWQPAAPDESMVVPSELIDLAKQRRSEGSLFAAALSENYLDSDIWNMMGTCAMLHRDDLGTLVAASMASSFYLPAVRFAALAPAARLKYQYNYLHSRAVEYEAVGDDAGVFLVSAVRFLSSAVAQFFHYRDERAEPLWKLIKRDWSRLSPAAQAELRRLIIARKWIQNKLPDVVALQ